MLKIHRDSIILTHKYVFQIHKNSSFRMIEYSSQLILKDQINNIDNLKINQDNTLLTNRVNTLLINQANIPKINMALIHIFQDKDMLKIISLKMFIKDNNHIPTNKINEMSMYKIKFIKILLML